MLQGLLLIVSFLFVLRTLVSYYRYRTSPILNNFPGPPLRSFILGYSIEKVKGPFLKYAEKWWREASEKEGRTVPFISFSILWGYPFVICCDPDITQEILTSPAARDSSRFERNYDIITELLGWGLLTLKGSAWHRHRRIIQPSFHARFVKEALSLSVPKRVQTLIAAWQKTAQGRNIDAFSHMSALTLDVIGDVAFSHEFHALEVVQEWSRDSSLSELPEISDPFINAFRDATKPSFGLAIKYMTGTGWLHKYIDPNFKKLVQLTNAQVDKVIKNARDSTVKTPNGTSLKKCKSLLQLLFDAKDTQPGSTTVGLSDVELRDELKTFMIAGHETTSVWCHWALYALGKFPSIQQRVYEDVCKHSKIDSDINADSVTKMTYMNAFLNEVLRLFPPVGFIFRHTTKEEHWKGYTIPANTRVDINFFLLHRHPDHWPKPLEFLPERWLDPTENSARHRCCFLPFSVGGRNCIGQSFAEIEAKLIISLIVRNFEIQLPDHIRDENIDLGGLGTNKSIPSVEITVKSRC